MPIPRFDVEILTESALWEAESGAPGVIEDAVHAASAHLPASIGWREIAIVLTDDSTIRSLNRDWRGQDKPGGQVLAVYDRVRLVEDGADLGHGIRLWHLPGHTPGHCGLRIGSNLVLVGDIVHSEALQLPQPALRPMFDVDPAQAAASCTAALTEIADGGLVWSGSHMLGPDKFARLVRDGAGFRRQPV